MALLPTNLYEAYRKPAPTRMSENHPPLNASPGELRLWQKLHGELDKGKAAEEARIHARNAGRRDVVAPPPAAKGADGVAKNGRRAGLRTTSAEAVRSGSPTETDHVSRRPTVDAVKLRAELDDKAAALTTSEARIASLEEQLRAMTEQRDAARAEAETHSAVATELQGRLESAAKAEKEKVEAMGARLSEVLAEWKDQQEEWAAHKAQLEAERDAALGRPPELLAAPQAPPTAPEATEVAHTAEEEQQAYSEDDEEDVEEE